MQNLNSTLSFQTLVNSLPGNHYFKDSESRYLAINNGFSNILKLESLDKLVGQSDFNQPWEQYADVYRNNDKKVISSNKSSIFVHPIVTYNKEKILIINKKIPFSNDEGTNIGILGSDIIITSNKALKMFEFQQEDIQVSDLSDIFEQYIMVDDFSDFGLTTREGQCLFYLIRGKTAKEIGNILLISKRTVEKHIEQVKSKLHCKTRSCLINKCISIGFANILPKGFFKDFLFNF